MMDLFATVLGAASIASPSDRVIDGRDILPLLTTKAKSPHTAVFGQAGAQLATVRNDRYKLHVLPPKDFFASLNKPGQKWIDARGPDGVTILAPHEQYQPDAYPGMLSGDAAKAMQLFDLQADPGEQKDVAGDHPEIVKRLKALFDEMNSTVAGQVNK
jgi:arylsulfatase A-like enzyme